MDDQQFKNVEILQRPRPNLPQFLLSHPCVVLEGNAVDVTSLRTVTCSPEEHGNASDTLGSASDTVQFCIDRKSSPLHTYQLTVIDG